MRKGSREKRYLIFELGLLDVVLAAGIEVGQGFDVIAQSVIRHAAIEVAGRGWFNLNGVRVV